MQKSIYSMIYIIKIYIMTILCFNRFLVFGHNLKNQYCDSVDFPPLRGRLQPHFYIYWALSGKYSKPQHISYNEVERYINI